MTRFVHTADWQLGMTRHFLCPEAQARFDAARLDAIGAIGALARREGCAFVVVAGDVFEANQVERQVVVRSLDAMGAHPEVTFYLLPGNHDPLDAASVFSSPTFERHRPPNVVVLADTAPVADPCGVEVVGAPWSSKRPLGDLVTAAARDLPDDGAPRVVVGHGGVDVLAPDLGDPALVVAADLERAVADGRCRYVALGDRHSTTQVGASGHIWYSGAPEPTAFDEVDPGNVLVVDLDGDVSVTPHRVGTWHFVAEQVELTGPEDVDGLERRLGAIDDKARTIVRLGLVGQLSLATSARLDALLDHHGDLFASLRRWERHSDLVVLPDLADEDALGLSGFAREALCDLRARAEGDGDDARVARDALALLYRLGSAA